MPRRNPRTKLTKLAFRDQDRLLQREMARAEKRYNFEAAALALSEWTGRGHEEMRAHGLRVIAEEVRKQFPDDAYKALDWLANLNRRLGVWCACAVARESLRFVPKGELRPQRAIQTTENWVRGIATRKQVRKAAYAAAKSASDGSGSAAGAAYAAAGAGYAVFLGKSWTSMTAAYAADAFPSAGYKTTMEAELRRFIDVVVEAIMTLPRIS